MDTSVTAPKMMRGMLGGMRMPSVPPQASSPRMNCLLYPRPIIAG